MHQYDGGSDKYFKMTGVMLRKHYIPQSHNICRFELVFKHQQVPSEGKSDLNQSAKQIEILNLK